MTTTASRTLGSWTFVLVLAACNTPAVDAPDAGVPTDACVRRDVGNDADAGDAGPGPGLPAVTNGTTSNPTAEAANYGCLGTVSAPPPGATISYGVELRGLGSGEPVAAARIWFLPDNRVTTTCTGSCVEVTTDASGNGTMSGPSGAWLAYRVFPRSGSTMATTFVGSFGVNTVAPTVAGGVVTARAVSVSTRNLIPAAFGFTRVPTTAMAVGAVRDCDGEAVRGAIIRLFQSDGTELVSDRSVNDAPHIQYFDGNGNPDGTTVFTQVDGLYAGANVPPPATGLADVRAEAWGVRSAGGPLELLGCEVVGVTSDGVSLVDIGPMRADYDPMHPCCTARH